MKVFASRLPGQTDRPNGAGALRAPAGGSAPLRVRAAGWAALVAATSSLATAGLLYGRGLNAAGSSSLLQGFLALALAAGLVTAVTAGLAVRHEPHGWSAVLAQLGRAWRDAGSGTMFFLGCVVMVPAFALHTRTLVGDADSARIVASVLYVRDNGFHYLVETQEVLLPHVLFRPLLAVGGIPALQVFDVLSVLALGGVVALIVWRLTRSPLAGLAAVLALSSLPPILERAYRLPMYSTMLAFGFLGVYLAHYAMKAERRSSKWQAAALAALCLVLAFEAHQVGQLFLVVAALLAVTARSVSALAGLGRVYLLVVVLAVPRLAINLAEGGLSHLLSNRVDYWVTKGYLKPIQTEFFSLPVGDPLGEYVRQLPDGVLGIWGWTGVLTLGLGIVGLLAAHGRLRAFALVCAGFFLAVVLHRRLPFYTRYFSLLLVGSAVAAGMALAVVRGDSRLRRAAVALGLVGLLATAVVGYGLTIDKLRTLERSVAAAPYLPFAQELPPGAGVVGARSVYLDLVATDVRTYGGQFLSEREYVTFLTWPSDRAVVELMRRHDIRWVFVPSQPWKWVRRYNDIWLRPAYGARARYDREVKRSPLFCRARKVDGASLYRLDPAGAADGVPAAGPRICTETA